MNSDKKFLNFNIQILLVSNRSGGFIVLYSPCSEIISLRLKKEGIWTDYHGNNLRFGPAPYLSDDQLKEAMSILKQVLHKNNFQ